MNKSERGKRAWEDCGGREMKERQGGEEKEVENKTLRGNGSRRGKRT